MPRPLVQNDAGTEVMEQIGSAIFGNDISLNGIITPAALTGDVNNYAPTGLATAGVLRLGGGSSDRNISGLLAPTSGKAQLLLILNIGTSNSLILNNQSASSSAGNKFFGPNAADVTIRKGGAIFVYYDITLAAWICVGI